MWWACWSHIIVIVLWAEQAILYSGCFVQWDKTGGDRRATNVCGGACWSHISIPTPPVALVGLVLSSRYKRDELMPPLKLHCSGGKKVYIPLISLRWPHTLAGMLQRLWIMSQVAVVSSCCRWRQGFMNNYSSFSKNLCMSNNGNYHSIKTRLQKAGWQVFQADL